jgi:sigma-54 specific flagellar transcriptional regulator A
MFSIDKHIIGSAPTTKTLKKMIGLVADSGAPVLIHGPTGSGKELVAEALHEESRRKGNFIAVNCAAIPSELIEAEIFGFEKGAFTGALNTTKGKFELAHNGSIFLDEIGDMPLALQSKLLRVLENAKITRVGGTKEIQLNVRVICASHKDLNSLSADGNFREDLLFRLNTLEISVPHLHQRVDDIAELIEHFLKLKVAGRKNTHPIFTDEAYSTLRKHAWPGNIRELRNVVERALIFFPNKKIGADDVEKYLIKFNNEVVNIAIENEVIWESFDDLSGRIDYNEQVSDDRQINIPTPEDFAKFFNVHNSIDLRRLLRDIEIVLIRAAMNRNDNNTSEAAKDLKLLRTTLIEKTKKYGI